MKIDPRTVAGLSDNTQYGVHRQRDRRHAHRDRDRAQLRRRRRRDGLRGLPIAVKVRELFARFSHDPPRPPRRRGGRGPRHSCDRARVVAPSLQPASPPVTAVSATATPSADPAERDPDGNRFSRLRKLAPRLCRPRPNRHHGTPSAGPSESACAGLGLGRLTSNGLGRRFGRRRRWRPGGCRFGVGGRVSAPTCGAAEPVPVGIALGGSRSASRSRSPPSPAGSPAGATERRPRARSQL